MTTARHEDSSGGRLLAALHQSLTPYVDDAGAASPATEWLSMEARVTPGAPVSVDIVCEDSSARVRRYHADCSGTTGDAVARAAGAVLEAGLNLLPVSKQQEVTQRQASGATLALLLNPTFGTCDVILVVDGTDESLCTLMLGDVH